MRVLCLLLDQGQVEALSDIEKGKFFLEEFSRGRRSLSFFIVVFSVLKVKIGYDRIDEINHEALFGRFRGAVNIIGPFTDSNQVLIIRQLTDLQPRNASIFEQIHML